MHELIDNEPAQWSSAFKASLAYFVVGFGFGFPLGTFRMLVIVPAVGEISAVMLESRSCWRSRGFPRGG
jgi:hypothetical protein